MDNAFDHGKQVAKVTVGGTRHQALGVFVQAGRVARHANPLARIIGVLNACFTVLTARRVAGNRLSTSVWNSYPKTRY